jgi:hypothetical protein
MSDTNEDTLIKFQEEYLQDEIVLKEELLGDSSFSFFQLIKNFIMLRNMQVATLDGQFLQMRNDLCRQFECTIPVPEVVLVLTKSIAVAKIEPIIGHIDT